MFILFRTAKKTLNFQVGDKVCCTKNGYVIEKDEKKKTLLADIRASLDNGGSQRQNDQKKERLCNGEIFFIKHVIYFYLLIYVY